MERDWVEVELLVPVECERGGHPEHEAARRRHRAGEAVQQHQLQPPRAVVVQRGGGRVGAPESCVNLIESCGIFYEKLCDFTETESLVGFAESCVNFILYETVRYLEFRQ